MTAHVLAGKFGKKDDQFTIQVQDSKFSTFNLLKQDNKLNYGIGQAIDDLTRIGIFPTELGLDLLILAIHVYCADLRISRDTEAQDGWTREIQLLVPVSAPDSWNSVKPLLVRMLEFLTGDRWSFEFRSRPDNYQTLIPTHLPGTEVKDYKTLALFSGGLDSLIGAINLLETGEPPLFISHAGDSATGHSQEACFSSLSKHYKSFELERLAFWSQIPNGLIDGVGSDKNQRSRSFLFFAIAFFAGTGLKGEFSLIAPENGLIAINVPLDPLRLGSLSTRTMHPFYLARWNELLKRLDIPGAIKNPYWNKTKGEMMVECSNPELLKAITPSSLSCSAPLKGRYQSNSTKHCGYCLPCLIRRAAINKAYSSESDETGYVEENLAVILQDTRRARGQQVRSVLYALERLKSQPSLAKSLIYKPGPLTDLSLDEISQLANVYGRGMEEVRVLLEKK